MSENFGEQPTKSTNFEEQGSLNTKNISFSKQETCRSHENRVTESEKPISLKNHERSGNSTVSLENSPSLKTYPHPSENFETSEAGTDSLENRSLKTYEHSSENHETTSEATTVSLENSPSLKTPVYSSKSHEILKASTVSLENSPSLKTLALSSKSHETLNTLPPDAKNSNWGKITRWFSFCEIEFLLLLFGVGTSFLSTFHDNVIYRRICIHQMEQKPDKCYNFENTPNVSSYELELEGVLDAASSHMAALLTIKLAVEFLSSVFLCPWSDTYGRKFPIIIAIIGGNFDLMAYFFSDSGFNEFFQVLYSSTILSSAFGGTVCIIAMSYSYGTEHSAVGFRTFKFTTMDISFVMGTIVGSMVLRNFPSRHAFLYNIILIFSVNFISALWILFVFEDKNFDGNSKLFEKFGQIFSTKNAGTNFEVLSRQRRDCEGEQLRLIIFSVAPVIIVHGMTEGVVILNGKHARWFRDFKQYTLVTQLFGVYSCVIEFVCIAFIHFFLKLQDSTIGLLGTLSLYLSCLMTGFARHRSTLMIALSLAAVKSFASVALRSTASKITQPGELGRTFLFISFSESIALTTGYIWHLKRSFLFGRRTYPDFSFFLLCTLLVAPFCVFMFQALSIHTTQLFRKCYRTIPIAMDDIHSQVDDIKEEFDS